MSLETRKNNMNKFSMLNGSPPLISDLVLRSEKLTLFQVHYLYAFNLPPTPGLTILGSKYLF